VAWLIGAVLVLSIGSATVPGMLSTLALQTGDVWSGQLWRLVTWCLLELMPLNLVFEIVLLYFFCPDLISRWGTRGFFIRLFGCGALTAAIVCLAFKVIPGEVGATLGRVPFAGLFALSEAIVIAWGALMPDRQILLLFVIPMSGRNLIFASIAITVIFAAMGGFIMYIPVFVAEGIALVYFDVFSFRRLYLRGRMAMLQRDYKRRTAHLQVVDRDRDEPPRWTH
jgi:membrane associated rhomboid family serine protease